MDVEVLGGLAGAILSLVMSYVPGAKDWFGALKGNWKRLVMLCLLLLAALVVFGLACAGVAGEFGVAATCDKAGILALVRAFLFAATANQTAYMLTPTGKPEEAGKGELRYEDIK